MGRYITVADMQGRYTKVSSDKGSASLNSDYIPYGEAYVEMRLASAYTAPFSSNNTTVKDLSMDASYLRIIKFTDTEKAKLIQDDIDSRIAALLDGSAQMVTTSGDLIGQNVSNAWSETDGYAPTFGVDDITMMQVSSAHELDEEQARKIGIRYQSI